MNEQMGEETYGDSVNDDLFAGIALKTRSWNKSLISTQQKAPPFTSWEWSSRCLKEKKHWVWLNLGMFLRGAPL